MYLRFRYRLGFEALCVEVADSLAWRRFCRVPLGERVPHPTTLMKITTRCGEVAIGELNEVLLAKAHEEKLIRVSRMDPSHCRWACEKSFPQNRVQDVASLSATVSGAPRVLNRLVARWRLQSRSMAVVDRSGGRSRRSPPSSSPCS